MFYWGMFPVREVLGPESWKRQTEDSCTYLPVYSREPLDQTKQAGRTLGKSERRSIWRGESISPPFPAQGSFCVLSRPPLMSNAADTCTLFYEPLSGHKGQSQEAIKINETGKLLKPLVTQCTHQKNRDNHGVGIYTLVCGSIKNKAQC